MEGDGVALAVSRFAREDFVRLLFEKGRDKLALDVSLAKLNEMINLVLGSFTVEKCVERHPSGSEISYLEVLPASSDGLLEIAVDKLLLGSCVPDHLRISVKLTIEMMDWFNRLLVLELRQLAFSQ